MTTAQLMAHWKRRIGEKRDGWTLTRIERLNDGTAKRPAFLTQMTFEHALGSMAWLPAEDTCWPFLGIIVTRTKNIERIIASS